jgi:hypothetical protein
MASSLDKIMTYNVTNLTNLGIVTDINFSGQMTGVSGVNPDAAILYTSPGQPQVPWFQVTPFNDWYNAAFPKPVPRPIPPKGGKGGGGAPTPYPVMTAGAAINDQGEIAGTVNLGPAPAANPQLGFRAFLRQTNGTIVDLHQSLLTAFNYTWSAATDLNNGPGEQFSSSAKTMTIQTMGRSIVGIGSQGPWQIWQDSFTGQWIARCLTLDWGLPLPSTVNYQNVLINNLGTIALDTGISWYLYLPTIYKLRPTLPGSPPSPVLWPNPFVQRPVLNTNANNVYGLNNNNTVLLQPGGTGGGVAENPTLFYPGNFFGFQSQNLGRNGVPGAQGFTFINGPRSYLNDQANLVVPTQAIGYNGVVYNAYVYNVSYFNLDNVLVPNSGIQIATVWGINNQGWIVGQDSSGNTVLLTPV